MWVLLNGDPNGFFALFAVVCTSFSAVNIATSGRNPTTPFGRLDLQYVKDMMALKFEIPMFLFLVSVFALRPLTLQPPGW